MSNDDDRLKRELGTAPRQSRAATDRPVVENRTVTDADRLEQFRATMHKERLPDIPKISGYHVCWLSTTNPSDTIQQRVRMGYEPIRADDAPGLDFATIKTGEYAGMIAVNEMLAFKLPEHLYQMFMKEAHHDAPMREENKLAETAELIKEQAARHGAALIEGNGISELRNSNVRRSMFD